MWFDEDSYQSGQPSSTMRATYIDLEDTDFVFQLNIFPAPQLLELLRVEDIRPTKLTDHCPHTLEWLRFTHLFGTR
jgi:hypothetical protein